VTYRFDLARNAFLIDPVVARDLYVISDSGTVIVVWPRLLSY
jgi:hypothetical protein